MWVDANGDDDPETPDRDGRAHLKQPAEVVECVLRIPAGVLHLVPAAGQQQFVGAVESGRVDGVAVDQADQVLSIVLPG